MPSSSLATLLHLLLEDHTLFILLASFFSPPLSLRSFVLLEMGAKLSVALTPSQLREPRRHSVFFSLCSTSDIYKLHWQTVSIFAYQQWVRDEGLSQTLYCRFWQLSLASKSMQLCCYFSGICTVNNKQFKLQVTIQVMHGNYFTLICLMLMGLWRTDW